MEDQSQKRVFLLPGSHQKVLDAEVEHFRLPSVKDSNILRNYVFNKHLDKVFEITKLDNFGSFFHGDYLIADGSFYSIIEVHKNFLALPYLIKARGKVDEENKGKMCEFKQIFSTDECKNDAERRGLSLLQQSLDLRRCLPSICDTSERSIDEEHYFMVRLNDQKLHSWLDAKLNKLKDFIKITLPTKYDPDNEKSLTILAIGFIYEYMADYALEQFTQRYGITSKMIHDSPSEKRKQPEHSVSEPSPTKQPTQSNSKNVKLKKTKTDEKNAKAAKGTRGMSAYLTKPATN